MDISTKYLKKKRKPEFRSEIVSVCVSTEVLDAYVDSIHEKALKYEELSECPNAAIIPQETYKLLEAYLKFHRNNDTYAQVGIKMMVIPTAIGEIKLIEGLHDLDEMIMVRL